MKKIGQIFTNIIIAILVIIVIILIYGFIQTNILKKDYAKFFGYTIFKVETASMEDTISIDDYIIIKIGNNDISENDIITYKENQSYVTHRVISIDGETIITKGDNNNTQDDPIQRQDVVGKVVYIVQNVAIWKNVFSDIKVIISCLVTIILFIIFILYKEKEQKAKGDGESV